MKHPHTHVPLLMFAVAVTLFVFGLYGYMYHTVNISLDHALAARDAVAKEQSLKLQETKLTDIYKKTTADRDRLAAFLVSDDKTISFIETVEDLGPQAGSVVTIASLKSDNLEAAAPGTLGKISLAVTVEGSWTAVIRTLQLAELLPYKLSISNIGFDTSVPVGTISATSTSPKSTPKWSGTFTLEAVLIHAALNQ